MHELQLIEMDAEPRVRDVDLAIALGFERPRVIRELIQRNRQELERFGISPYGTAKLNPGRGRPSVVCFLNEPQALLVCMFARTEKAAAVRKQVIEVFLAWRSGTLAPRAPAEIAQPMRIDRSNEFFRIIGDESFVTIHAYVPKRAAYKALIACFNAS